MNFCLIKSAKPALAVVVRCRRTEDLIFVRNAFRSVALPVVRHEKSLPREEAAMISVRKTTGKNLVNPVNME